MKCDQKANDNGKRENSPRNKDNITQREENHHGTEMLVPKKLGK